MTPEQRQAASPQPAPRRGTFSMKRRSKVFEILIGSRADEKLGDRYYDGDRRYIATFKLPVVARYIIEAHGWHVAQRKALAQAVKDGIDNPILKGGKRLDVHIPPAMDDLFEGLSNP